jgi:2-iminobutanoate/2-iminopropanoate deaminase
MPVQFIAGANVEGLPLSEAVTAGEFIFVSGLVGFGPDGQIVSGGVAAETDRIMLDAKDILQRAGSSLTDIVKASVYLRHAGDFDAFNDAYARYFPACKPARVSLVADLTTDARVEIEFIAYVGDR